jgi:hypothetical protein
MHQHHILNTSIIVLSYHRLDCETRRLSPYDYEIPKEALYEG